MVFLVPTVCVLFQYICSAQGVLYLCRISGSAVHLMSIQFTPVVLLRYFPGTPKVLPRYSHGTLPVL